jgi:hypothetical protein
MPHPRADNHRPQTPPPQPPPTITDLDLETRVSRALTEQPPSADVVALLGEVRRAAARADEAAAAARETAMDPALSSAELAEARAEMENAVFRRDRARAAIVRLDERLREIERLEEQSRRQEAYDKAKAERDELAAELAGIYPEFAPRLARVLRLIAASDHTLRVVNSQLPDGSARLYSAEAVARGFGDSVFVQGGIAIPRLTDGVRLPHWSREQRPLYGEGSLNL